LSARTDKPQEIRQSLAELQWKPGVEGGEASGDEGEEGVEEVAD